MPDPNNPNPDGNDPGSSDVSIVNPDGSFVENWYEKYGEENQEHLKRYKNLDAIVNSHIATKRKFGRDPDTLVQIPQDDSSDEVKAAFRKAGGKPDTSDEYDYKLPVELSTKVEANEERLSKFKKFAHEKLHLNKTQFVDALNFYYTDMAESIGKYDTIFAEQEQSNQEEGNAVLKKVFHEGTEERKSRANRLLNHYGLKPIKLSDGKETTLKEELFAESPKLLTSPWMIMFLDSIASAMSEDTIKGLSPITTPSSADTKAKIAEIRSRMDKIVKDNPVNFKANAEYKSLTAQKTELYKRMTKK